MKTPNVIDVLRDEVVSHGLHGATEWLGSVLVTGFAAAEATNGHSLTALLIVGSGAVAYEASQLRQQHEN